MNENISLISKYISIITKQIFEKYGNYGLRRRLS